MDAGTLCQHFLEVRAAAVGGVCTVADLDPGDPLSAGTHARVAAGFPALTALLLCVGDGEEDMAALQSLAVLREEGKGTVMWVRGGSQDWQARVAAAVSSAASTSNASLVVVLGDARARAGLPAASTSSPPPTSPPSAVQQPADSVSLSAVGPCGPGAVPGDPIACSADGGWRAWCVGTLLVAATRTGCGRYFRAGLGVGLTPAIGQRDEGVEPEDVHLGAHPALMCPSLQDRIDRLHAELHDQQFPDAPTTADDRPLQSAESTVDAGAPEADTVACASRRLLVFEYGTDNGNQGFSVVFQYLAAALLVARAANRTLVEVHNHPDVGGEPAVDPWVRASPVLCGHKKFGCFFSPLSSCSMHARSRQDVLALPALDFDALAQQPDRVVRIVFAFQAHHLRRVTAGHQAPLWFLAPQRQPSPGQVACIPRVDVHDRSPARLWFPAFEAYLFRPLPAVVPPSLHSMCRSLATLSENNPSCATSVGVHVRHGDTSVLAYRGDAYRGWSSYLAVAGPLVTGQPPWCPRRVALVLATDNTTLQHLVQATPDPLVEVITADMVAGDAAGAYVVDAALSAVTMDALLAGLSPAQAPIAYNVTVGLIQDIFLLSCTSHFVGTCMSQVGRLASELMYVAGRMRHSPVGLDTDLCRQYPAHPYSMSLDWRSQFDVWR